MNIGDKYKIEADSLNITLYEKFISQKGKNKGQAYWRGIAYFSCIENALHHLVDLEVTTTDLKDLKTVVKKQAALHSLISGLDLSDKRCSV